MTGGGGGIAGVEEGPWLQDGTPDRGLAFGPAREVFVAHRLGRVAPTLAEVCRRVEATGRWAVGFVAYEAAPAFDPALAAHPPAVGGPPLLFFTLHDPPRRQPVGGRGGAAAAFRSSVGEYRVGPWEPSVGEAAYRRRVEEVRRRIALGDTYQVNYTYRLRAPFDGDPRAFFADLAAAQLGGHGGYLEAGDHALCSASPELFFELADGVVATRPMKGTAPRGRWPEEDRQRAAALAASEKERAENLMIVDMMRNDLGRVAETGSVRVPELFAVERYPTVWQMTSTVTARLEAGGDGAGGDRAGGPVPRLFAALFPCASITGAPKASTSAIIRELEDGPRGLYTGALGWIAPGGRARFGVAIRTAVVDRRRGEVEYGVGGGVVWDSDPAGEAAESRLKARVLPGGADAPQHGTGPPPPFELLETLLWTPAEGIWLLEEHLDRLEGSALYFGGSVLGGSVLGGSVEAGAARSSPAARAPELREAARCALESAVEEALSTLRTPVPLRLRLLAARAPGSQNYTVRVQATPLAPEDLGAPDRRSADVLPAVPVAPAAAPVDDRDVFLFHKTTRRTVYETALAERPPGAEEVLLWNRRRELTEGATTNLVVAVDGRLLTPPVECGLLAGTFRRRLLESGEVEEGVVGLADLPRCDGLWLVNSVRRWRRARLLP